MFRHLYPIVEKCVIQAGNPPRALHFRLKRPRVHTRTTSNLTIYAQYALAMLMRLKLFIEIVRPFRLSNPFPLSFTIFLRLLFLLGFFFLLLIFILLRLQLHLRLLPVQHNSPCILFT